MKAYTISILSLLTIISGCSRSKPNIILPKQAAPTVTQEIIEQTKERSVPTKICDFYTVGKESFHYQLGFENRPDGKVNLRIWRAASGLGNPKDEQWFEVSTFVADYVPRGKDPDKIPLVKGWTNGSIWLLFEVANGASISQELWELSGRRISVKKVK